MLPYEEGKPTPPGYRVVNRPHTPVAIAGGALFLLAYLPSVYVAALAGAAGDGDDFSPLYIPVAGPFITIETANAETGGAFWLMLDGAAQAGGIVTGIVGLVMPDDKMLYRNGGVRVRLTPVASPGLSGVGVRGTF
ncbi:MAG: hypothetical protein IT372_25700 [Polyangiaceae bacterium]|nr:hypothetical protein [Polyangiaceae bacterium]